MITPSVKQIILQHHEEGDGSGFPYGLRASKIFTLSKIVHLADEFAHILVEQKCPPVIGLKNILSNENSTKRFHSVVLEKFTHIFVDPKLLKRDESNLPSNSRLVKTVK